MPQTVLYEVQQACLQLSLPKPADVYGSQDETALLMGSCANLAGVLVNGVRDWQMQRQPLDILCDGIRTSFNLPSDFERFVQGTGWSLANQCPVAPVSSQQWARIKVQLTTDSEYYCRLSGNMLQFMTPPYTGDTVSFEYVSKHWVIDAEDGTVKKEVAAKNGDMPVFDWTLMMLAIKVKWLEAKKMDTAAAMSDFMDRINQVTNGDILAPDLSLNSGMIGEHRYLDAIGNLPSGGFGGP